MLQCLCCSVSVFQVQVSSNLGLGSIDVVQQLTLTSPDFNFQLREDLVDSLPTDPHYPQDDLGLGSDWVHDSIPAGGAAVRGITQKIEGVSTMLVRTETRSGPLNLFLPWPRFESQCKRREEGGIASRDDKVPPIQEFKVRWSTSSMSDAVQQHASIAPSLSTPGTKRQWPQGGLKGGHSFGSDSMKIDIDSVMGWWLCIRGLEWVPLDCCQIAGRTVRQERERERLRLMELDTTESKIYVISRLGTIQVTWHYKFPHLNVNACPKDPPPRYPGSGPRPRRGSWIRLRAMQCKNLLRAKGRAKAIPATAVFSDR